MKKEYKTKLKQLESKLLHEKYPNVPIEYLAHTAYSESSANGLTRSVIRILEIHGFQAERINTMGVYRGPKKYTDMDGIQRTVGKGRYTRSTGTPGSADISATIAGKSVKIEIKYGKDRLSEAQKAYRDSIERAGGVYIVVRELDVFYEWLLAFADIE
jgi:hypothetical protein